MKADTILNNAAQLIVNRGVERDKKDGERSMERCVKSFNEMTGHNLTETDGWKFMMFLKMARMEGGAFKFDDYEDNVSYAALMAESAMQEKCNSESERLTVSEGVAPFPKVDPNGVLGGPPLSPLIGGCTEPPRETCVDKEPEQIAYDDYEACPKCGEKNAISIKDRYSGVPSEVETRCTRCSHLDYWAFGHYEVGAKNNTEVAE